MYKELKKEICIWLFDNENEWQRVNSCAEHFREYIFNSDGEFLIGGRVVSKFIGDMDSLIYK